VKYLSIFVLVCFFCSVCPQTNDPIVIKKSTFLSIEGVTPESFLVTIKINRKDSVQFFVSDSLAHSANFFDVKKGCILKKKLTLRKLSITELGNLFDTRSSEFRVFEQGGGRVIIYSGNSYYLLLYIDS
jgi:hypothetical protein